MTEYELRASKRGLTPPPKKRYAGAKAAGKVVKHTKNGAKAAGSEGNYERENG